MSQGRVRSQSLSDLPVSINGSLQQPLLQRAPDDVVVNVAPAAPVAAAPAPALAVVRVAAAPAQVARVVAPAPAPAPVPAQAAPAVAQRSLCCAAMACVGQALSVVLRGVAAGAIAGGVVELGMHTTSTMGSGVGSASSAVGATLAGGAALGSAGAWVGGVLPNAIVGCARSRCCSQITFDACRTLVTATGTFAASCVLAQVIGGVDAFSAAEPMAIGTAIAFGVPALVGAVHGCCARQAPAPAAPAQ